MLAANTMSTWCGRERTTIRTAAGAPAITRAMLDLCSAPCKALRFASTAHTHPNAAAALGAPG
jgi:hypothetical protein